MATYTFIDGGYLYRRFEEIMGGVYGTVPRLEIEHVKLGGNRIFYYDALEEQDPEKESAEEFAKRTFAKQDLHQFISRIPNFHLRQGYIRGRKKGQKAVDVLLSVDALEHAARRNMVAANLLAGDLDFEPLVKSLVGLGIYVQLYYCPVSVASELLDSVDVSNPITVTGLYTWAGVEFQSNHPRVNIDCPSGHYGIGSYWRGLNFIRKGQWGSRTVDLFQTPGQLYVLLVGPGKMSIEVPIELTGNSEHQVVASLELSYGGKVVWS